MTLHGKVGIVTGGSKGMGRHFVATLIAAGARVACFARRSPESDTLAAEFGDNVLFVPCDVSEHGQVDSGVAQVVEKFGRLDFLVNNAAIFHPFLLEKATPRQIEQHIGVNLTGPIWCIRAAIPHLRETRGNIVTISSESVRLPYPYLSMYAATKAGAEVLSQALRDELREDGIRVTLLRSGAVAGSTGSTDWDPAVATAFMETIRRTGHAAFAGAAATPQSMAKSLLAVLTLPDDINVDFIEVRASRPMAAP